MYWGISVTFKEMTLRNLDKAVLEVNCIRT